MSPTSYAALFSGFGQPFQDQVARHFGRGIALSATGQWLPSDSTFVDLDPTVHDENGLAVARITSALGHNEVALLKQMAACVRSVLVEAGITELAFEQSALDCFAASHVLGTCRMGTDSHTSVADKDSFSHEVPNLAFADGSLIPSTGSGDSPFLTITAMSIRTADRIASRLDEGKF